MLKKIIIAAALVLVMEPSLARAEELYLMLCPIHGDAWFGGAWPGTRLLEFEIESTDGALVPGNYQSMQSRGYSQTPPLSVTDHLIWDQASDIQFAPPANYQLGFTYNYMLDRGLSHWSFSYDIGSGMTQGTVMWYYIPEPGSLAALACAGLLALRVRKNRNGRASH